MENIDTPTTVSSTSQPAPTHSQEHPSHASHHLSSHELLNVPITDENVALNLLVAFVNIAHSRNAFNLAESSKIWNCIQKFVQQPDKPTSTIEEPVQKSESVTETA
jgi:hypothetical protein